MKKAIVLLSGGLDSSTALYLAKSQGFDEIYAITFEYGQKHDKELKSAIAIAKAAGVKEHKIVNLLLNQWSGCALTDPDMEVEDGHIERQDSFHLRTCPEYGISVGSRFVGRCIRYHGHLYRSE